MLTTEEKRRLAGRARTVSERLEANPARTDGSPGPGERRTESGGVDSGGVADRETFERWKNNVANGDPETFSTRLEIASVTHEEAERRITDDQWPHDEPVPEWIETVDELLEHLVGQPPEGGRHEGANVPFAPLLGQIVSFARQRLSINSTHVTPKTIESFERHLLGRLEMICAQPLHLEFAVFRRETGRKGAYDRFIDRLFDGRVAAVFSEYPVLARFVSKFVTQWVEMTEAFFGSLDADYDRLEAAFGELGEVVSVEMLGDPHRRGKMVHSVTFDSGTTVVYKPRPVRAEAAFFEIVEWVNDNSSAPNLPTLRCVTADDRGWVEWVDSEPCSEQSGVSRYYRRAGALVCLMYALNFTDCHYENLIAAGDSPVVVDLETVGKPDPTPEEFPLTDLKSEIYLDSCIRTGALPTHTPDSDIDNTGGFEGDATRITGIEQPVFTDRNTDDMSLHFEEFQPLDRQNLPRLDGREQQPAAYGDEIRDGFTQMYRFLLDSRESFGELVSDTLSGVTIRLIVRSSELYDKVRLPLRNSTFLRNGATFGSRVEILAKLFVRQYGEIDKSLWQLYRGERWSLWNFDLPRFDVQADGTDLAHETVVLEDFFDRSPLEQVSERIESLSVSDLDRQLRYLSLAYDSPTDGHGQPLVPDGVSTTRSVDKQTTDDTVSLRRECVRLGDRCLDTALDIFDDGPDWALRRNRGDGVEIERVSDTGVGRLGVGVFTAGLAQLTDERRFGEFTHTLLSSVVDEPTTAAPPPGVTAYYLSTVGELTGVDRYLQAAQKALQTTPDRGLPIGRLSGRVLGGLKLSQVGDRQTPSEAVAAGEELLRRGRQTATGSYTWSAPVYRPQTPSLGSDVGVSYALARLDGTTEQSFGGAVRESRPLAGSPGYPVVGTVPQIPDPNHSPVSRLALLTATENDSHVQSTAAELRRRPLGPVDALAVGNCRRIDSLVYAGNALGESSHFERATGLASRLASGRDETYALPWNVPEWTNPTVRHGLAGVGYTLLRVLDPELPSLLAWE